jgi:hypothetical protein
MYYCSKFFICGLRFCIFDSWYCLGCVSGCCNFWDSPFYSRYNAQIFFRLTRINAFMDLCLWFFLVQVLCVQTTLLHESGKELKNQLLTSCTVCNHDRSYLSGIFSAQIWETQFCSPSLRCYWKTTGSTYTIVPAMHFPDWCRNFMATWSSFRMMTEDWSCRLWSEARQFWLTPSLSVLWSGSLFYQSLEFLFLMRLPAMIFYMTSLERDDNERTSPTPRSTSVPLLLYTDS